MRVPARVLQDIGTSWSVVISEIVNVRGFRNDFVDRVQSKCMLRRNCCSCSSQTAGCAGRTGSSCSARGRARTSQAPSSPVPSAAASGTSVPCRSSRLKKMGSSKASCRGRGVRRQGGIQSTVGQVFEVPCRHSRNERRQDVGSSRHGVSVQRALDPAGGIDDQMVHVLGQELQNSGVHGPRRRALLRQQHNKQSSKLC